MARDSYRTKPSSSFGKIKENTLEERSNRAKKKNTNNVGHLSEWLLGNMLLGFVLVVVEENWDKGVRDLHILEDNSNTLGAGGDGIAMESEYHLYA